MVLNNIEELLEKYNNAKTTLKEEVQLQVYFTSKNIAPHLEHYKPLFQYFSQSQQEQYTKDVPLHTKNRSILYQWISVAAVAVLMLGFIIPQIIGPTEKEKQEALLVYNQTIEAFNLVSLGMNKGKQQLNSLALVSNNLNHGIEGASKLSEFSKTTNRFLKNNTQINKL